MEVNILAFGRIAELTAAREWKMQGVRSTEEVRQQLEATYPALQGMRYALALNKKIITADTPLSEGAELALLPPFSGG
ncbi:MoaD/ThiS family protein [Cesiribacter andamanensis]|uniref:Molybdopterin synthase small subunit n=1 Tax=Cesiribacter andamanensis AMV16 TaxID=1279009 RepID=M7N4T3_9BACT|nr:MoaD/ThiS family protein [Cesiribacter andamanensis]EMR03673.1 molybdopterin synthase small subunit [Cesiribacter andamanensis AMV16]